jgi:transposase
MPQSLSAVYRHGGGLVVPDLPGNEGGVGLEVDNNLCENAIRPTAVGKKNFLFIEHPEAGQRSAVIYSVLGSCRRLGINPAEYLHDIFERLPKAKTSEVKSLTPAAWLQAKRNAARPSA